MLAVDSSVWIAHFRNVISSQVRLLRSLFDREELLVGDIVLMEVLRGARDEPHAARPGREMRDFEIVPMLGEALAIQVARNDRALRAAGFTVRRAPDLIIGTCCIEHSHTLLHRDRDFEPMRVHLGLQVA